MPIEYKQVQEHWKQAHINNYETIETFKSVFFFLLGKLRILQKIVVLSRLRFCYCPMSKSNCLITEVGIRIMTSGNNVI